MSSNLKKLTLDEIHLKTLDVMDFIHDFCERNNIKYVLGYGTLLGAVRHKGFIPWDDDFDIQMSRHDFDKFCELFEKEEGGYYKLICRAKDEKYTYAIPRVFDDRFIYEPTFERHKKITGSNMGVFIDVYPFDNFGNDNLCAHKLVRKIKRMNFLYSVYVNKLGGGNFIRSIVRLIVHYLLRFAYGSHYNKKIDKRICKIINDSTSDSDKYVGQVSWEVGERQFDKEWFAERLLAQFEDRMYWIPKDFDQILRKSYGDYMTLPPENQRVAYHGYNIYLKNANEGDV